MDLLKILPIILIVFVSGCATQVNRPESQSGQANASSQQPAEAPQQPTGQGTLQGEVRSPTQQEQSSPPLPTTKEFTIEADDNGFYINNQKISSISASKDNLVKITYQVRSQNVYHSGLDFRGCGQNSGGTMPGSSTVIQFTAVSTCTITSYWPSTNAMKDSMGVVIS